MKEKFVGAFLSKLLNVLIQSIAFYLLFLNLDIILFGTWALALSIINLGFIFTTIGFEVIYLQYSGEKDSSKYFGTYFCIKGASIILSIIITLIIITFLQLWSSDFILILMLLLLARILLQVSNIFIINLISRLKVFKGEIPLLIIGTGKSISIIYIALNLESFSNPLLDICIFRCFFNLLLFLIIFYFSRNEFYFNKIEKKYLYNFLRDVKPLILYFVISLLATNFGNIILAYSSGHEALGYYSIINTYFISILIMLSSLLNQLFVVLFSRYIAMNKLSIIKKIVYILEKYYSIFFSSIILIVFLNAELIFLIFLPTYEGSILVIYILIIIPFMLGISRPYQLVLNSGKKQKIAYNIQSLINVFIIILMIFLIPPSILIFQTLGLGVDGYALAQTIPWILWVISVRYFCNKYFKIQFQKSVFLHLALVFLSIFITIVARNFILNEIFGNPLIILIFSSLMGFGLFLGFLIVFKELDKKDVKFLLELVNLVKITKSFKEEFN